MRLRHAARCRSCCASARRLWPIPQLGSDRTSSRRYDDVREVFATDRAFGVPYKANLDVIMGGEPFFLGMADTPEYQPGATRCAAVMRRDDIPALARQAEAQAEAIVAGAGGRIEVVDQLVRRVTFDLFGDYFGVPDPPGGDLRVWGTRLFEFQFADDGSRELAPRSTTIGTALRAHIDAEIARRQRRARRQGRRAGALPRAAGEGRARLFRRRDPHRA